jgi:hypothetical protein
MLDSDGVEKSVKGFRFELRGLLKVSSQDLLDFSIPYFNQEFSRYSPDQVFPNSLDDSTVRRADAIGDISLGWRRSLFSVEALGLGASLELSLPTGQGPFNSSHPLVATGEGGFVAALALDALTGSREFPLWIQGRLPWEPGYSADIAPGTFLSFSSDPSNPIHTLAGGRAYVSRGFSYELDGGLGWLWYETPHAAHRLAVELKWTERAPLALDGLVLDETRQESFEVLPQARFSFSGGYALNLGWILPLYRQSNQAVSYFGEVLARMDFDL